MKNNQLYLKNYGDCEINSVNNCWLQNVKFTNFELRVIITINFVFNSKAEQLYRVFILNYIYSEINIVGVSVDFNTLSKINQLRYTIEKTKEKQSYFW